MRQFQQSGRTAVHRKQALKKQMDAFGSQELRVTLFIRTPKGIQLTPAGQAFLTEAQQLTEAMFNAAERCRSIADQQQKIRIEAPNHPRLLLEKVITPVYPAISLYSADPEAASGRQSIPADSDMSGRRYRIGLES